MHFTSSIKQNYEFRRIYARGKSVASGLIVVYCRRNGRDANQLGLTVGTKVGKAVIRNRVRRRLKAIYRLHESTFRRGFDIVIVARVRSKEASYGQLEADFLRLTDKLGLRSGREKQ
ncbi:MAG: ribonuclease P protein component [Oscillospiraceae bacterium]|nr:ribonuclease P protein component [Oscillospiraceae bacterium]